MRSENSAHPLTGGRTFWILIAVGTVVLVAIWLLIPWQWSPVDDPGQFLTMRGLIESQGPLGAVITRIGQLASGDHDGGVFRPVAWVYPPLMYSLPVRISHTIRLLMLIVIIVGPLTYFRRRGAGAARLWMTFFLLAAAASTLYEGLLLLSLQEVGGMALVSIGLLTDNRITRLILWTLAAWFKGPFSWLLIGNAVMLWREGRRRMAVASGVIGLATLAINVWWSRSGSYTGRYRIDPFDPELWKSAAHILEPMNAILLVSMVWWLLVTQSKLVRRTDFALFGIAFAGYYLQMIPWGFTAYYMGPISFLLGLALASMLSDPDAPLSIPALSISLLVPALVAGWLIKDSLSFVFRTNSLMSQASECLSQIPGSNSVLIGDWLYVTSSPEGPVRIAQNTEIFHPGWTGTVSTENNSESVFEDAATTHAIVLGGATLPTARSATEICTAGSVQVFALS